MKKQFFLNLLLNLGIVFLVLSGVNAYKLGNMLILGLSIAIAVVLIYLKIVLLKHVKQDMIKKREESEKAKTLPNTSKKNKK